MTLSPSGLKFGVCKIRLGYGPHKNAAFLGVQFSMIRIGYNHKIVYAVVSVVSIDMVNIFIPAEKPTEVLLHNKSMFKNIPSCVGHGVFGAEQKDVTTPINAAPPVPSRCTRAKACFMVMPCDISFWEALKNSQRSKSLYCDPCFLAATTLTKTARGNPINRRLDSFSRHNVSLRSNQIGCQHLRVPFDQTKTPFLRRRHYFKSHSERSLSTQPPSAIAKEAPLVEKRVRQK